MKGVANHFRIEILALLKDHPERSLSGIAEELENDYKTVSEHVRKMAHAGLVTKRHDGLAVLHKLTKLGEHVLKFLGTIAND